MNEATKIIEAIKHWAGERDAVTLNQLDALMFTLSMDHEARELFTAKLASLIQDHEDSFRS